jgi:hypothetical protein
MRSELWWQTNARNQGQNCPNGVVVNVTERDDSNGLDKATIDEEQTFQTAAEIVVDQRPLREDCDHNYEHREQSKRRRFRKLSCQLALHPLGASIVPYLRDVTIQAQGPAYCQHKQDNDRLPVRQQP